MIAELSILDTITAMRKAGCDDRQILSVVEQLAKAEQQLRDEQREKARIKKERQRNMLKNINAVLGTDGDRRGQKGTEGDTPPPPQAKEKRSKKENSTPPPTPKENPPYGGSKEKGCPPERFEEAFLAFPVGRKGTRTSVMPAYVKALQRASPQEIIDGIMAYAKSNEAKTHPKGMAAWLNADRWSWDYETIDRNRREEGKPYAKPTHTAYSNREQSFAEAEARLLAKYSGNPG